MSKKQYTYVDKRGNRLFIREAWKDGDVLVQNAYTLDEFDYELFLPASQGVEPDAKSIYGEPLSRLVFKDINSMMEFADNHRCHAMDDPVAQWVAKSYPNEIQGDMSLVTVLNVDIEVEHSQGFPNPDKAEQEVMSISLKYFGSDTVTLGLLPLERKGYINCFNEEQLLETFLQLYTRRYPDIITGWNVELFDVTYLVNRITNVLGKDKAKLLSPFHKKHRDAIQPNTDYRGEPYYKILGVTTVDYLELYKKFSPAKLESYKLDFVANAELGTGKVDYSAYGNSLMRLYRGEPNLPTPGQEPLEVQRWKAVLEAAKVARNKRVSSASTV